MQGHTEDRLEKSRRRERHTLVGVSSELTPRDLYQGRQTGELYGNKQQLLKKAIVTARAGLTVSSVNDTTTTNNNADACNQGRSIRVVSTDGRFSDYVTRMAITQFSCTRQLPKPMLKRQRCVSEYNTCFQL